MPKYASDELDLFNPVDPKGGSQHPNFYPRDKKGNLKDKNMVCKCITLKRGAEVCASVWPFSLDQTQTILRLGCFLLPC